MSNIELLNILLAIAGLMVSFYMLAKIADDKNKPPRRLPLLGGFVGLLA